MSRETARPDRFFRVPAPLIAGLAGLGLVVTLTVTPGVFTVDDLNYLVTVLAAREGHVTVVNTEGLTASRELLFFDPIAHWRAVEATPVAPATPPLYGLIAVPFSWFGWRGLVGLNTFAYLATVLMVFLYTRRHSVESLTPWVAATAFAFGGYALEYAQGLWPQALSFALCTAGIFIAGEVINTGGFGLAAISGFLLAVAAGVRYQNALIVAAVAAGVLFLARRHRWRSVIGYALGVTAPMVVSSLINHSRLNSWNPISKGSWYLSVPIDLSPGQRLQEAITMFWAQLVDYSARPPLAGPDNLWLTYGPVSGAHLMLGLVAKKAFLQSAPWAVLGLIMFLGAWWPKSEASSRQRQLRLLGLVSATTLAAFSFAGMNRHEGLAFNARYLLELLPLAAVAFAWSLDDGRVRIAAIAHGAMGGSLLALAILTTTPPGDREASALSVLRHMAVLKLPVAMAFGLGTLWWLDRRGFRVHSALLTMIGVALGWGFAIHILDDAATAHRLRVARLAETRALEQVLPDNSALVAYWGNKDPIGPVLLERDVVVLDAHADEGSDTPQLIRELLEHRRRVFLIKDGFTTDLLQRLTQGLQADPVPNVELSIVELSAR